MKGYTGDVWYPQPAPERDPWRKMPNRAMTPRQSRTSLGAQTRYSDVIKDCLESLFAGESIDRGYIILEEAG